MSVTPIFRQHVLLSLLSLLSLPLLAAPAPLHVVERSDFSRTVDGRYLGHAWRESRIILEPKGTTTGAASGSGEVSGWRGEYFVLEETLRDARSEARRVDESGSGALSLGILGSVGLDASCPLPSLRGLLDLSRSSYRRGFPDTPPLAGADPSLTTFLPLGASFIAPGLRVLELRGEAVQLPYLAEYRVTSQGSYAGRPALLVKAKFATRLDRPRGQIASATGTHDLDIWLDLASGLPLFVRDLFDETFVFSDGGKEKRAGSALTFWQGGDSTGRQSIVASLGEALGGGAGPAAGEGGPGLNAPDLVPGSLLAGPMPVQGEVGEPEVAPSPDAEAGALIAAGGPDAGLELGQGEAGVVLRIVDLRFKADSDELLAAEKSRLDLVAKALAAAPPGRSFLVEGHAAAAGKPQGELELSQRRAKRIVDEMVSRGLPPSRFIYRGLGSTKPLAPNDSEANKARNRRVEITILD